MKLLQYTTIILFALSSVFFGCKNTPLPQEHAAAGHSIAQQFNDEELKRDSVREARKYDRFSMFDFATLFLDEGKGWHVSFTPYVKNYVLINYKVLSIDSVEYEDGPAPFKEMTYIFTDSTELRVMYDAKNLKIESINYSYNHSTKNGESVWEQISWDRPERGSVHMKGNWHVGRFDGSKHHNEYN